MSNEPSTSRPSRPLATCEFWIVGLGDMSPSFAGYAGFSPPLWRRGRALSGSVTLQSGSRRGETIGNFRRTNYGT